MSLCTEQRDLWTSRTSPNTKVSGSGNFLSVTARVTVRREGYYDVTVSINFPVIGKFVHTHQCRGEWTANHS